MGRSRCTIQLPLTERYIMKRSFRYLYLALGTLLATPLSASADFTFSEFPQFVEDQAPNWLFEILFTILATLAEALFTLLSEGTAG